MNIIINLIINKYIYTYKVQKSLSESFRQVPYLQEIL